MSNHDKAKEAREWANLVVTILGPVVIAWLVWSMNSKFEVERLNIEKAADQKYQTKEDANAFQIITNAKLDKITDAADATRQDIAVIKSQLATMNNRRTLNQ